MKFSRRQLAAAIPGAALAARRLPPLPIKLVVLDVGGTIVEDRGDVPALLTSALANHGVPSTAAEIAQRRGASKREVVRYFVDRHAAANVDRARLANAIYGEFTARLIEVYRTVPPIAGAEDAIRELRAANLQVAASTGFDRAVTSSIFQRLGWERYFCAVVTSDDVLQGRPAPYMLFHAMESAGVTRVADVMAVGDTPLDLQAGNNAGLGAVIGVLSGAGSAEQLRKEPHTDVLPSVAALPRWLAARRPA